MRIGRGTLAVGLLAGTLLLTGCDTQPGAAARVGSESIGVAEVDGQARTFCDDVAGDLAERGASAPMKLVRTSTVQLLTLGSLADQLIAANPDVDYRDQAFEAGRAQVARQTEGFDSSTREMVEGGVRFDAIRRALGPEKVQAWVDRNGVSFDPAFAMDFDPTASQREMFPAASGQTSYPASDLARSLAEASSGGDPRAVAGLPPSQRCG